MSGSADGILTYDLSNFDSHTPTVCVKAREIRRIGTLKPKFEKSERILAVQRIDKLFGYTKLLSLFLRPFEIGGVLPPCIEELDGPLEFITHNV